MHFWCPLETVVYRSPLMRFEATKTSHDVRDTNSYFLSIACNLHQNRGHNFLNNIPTYKHLINMVSTISGNHYDMTTKSGCNRALFIVTVCDIFSQNKRYNVIRTTTSTTKSLLGIRCRIPFRTLYRGLSDINCAIGASSGSPSGIWL